MNKPASELIALADLLDRAEVRKDWTAQLLNDPSEYNYINVSVRIPQAKAFSKALRLAANQSGSERAGVDALREAWQWHGDYLKKDDPDWVAEATEPGEVWTILGTASFGLKAHTAIGPVKVKAGWWISRVGDEIHVLTPTLYAALATPPAQPAPANESSTSSDGGVELLRIECDALRAELKELRKDKYYDELSFFKNRVKELERDVVPASSDWRGCGSLPSGESDPVVTQDYRPSEASTHGKPDGAVREAVCCSAISPCEYQRTHRTGVCETCQKAATLHSSKIAAAETSPGDVVAVKEACKRIALDHTPAKFEGTLAAHVTGMNIVKAIDRIDVKAEAKSQEPEAVAFGMYDTQMGRSARLMMVRLCNGQDGCDVPLYLHPPSQKPRPQHPHPAEAK